MRGRVDIGVILKQTFATYFANFVPFTVLSALLLSPVLFVNGLSLMRTLESPDGDLSLTVVSLGLTLVLTPILAAALTYGVFQHIRGKRADLGQCLSMGLRRMLPVLGLSLLIGLCAFLGVFTCGIATMFFTVIWAAAVPAAVIEDAGVVGSMRRSQELTRGYRWEVFGIIMVLFVINMTLTVGMTFLSFLLASLSEWLLIVPQLLMTVVMQGFQSTYPTLVYYHLRSAKETVDLDEIAAVFD
ncbi:MAG: hypothetical protein H6828_01125 [Planctomycetes bacterium]|nr:hypothetical protein [Planctomycetota bacterium]